LIRSEGVAERLGDIVLTCTGPAGRTISGNLTLSLNTTITNRITGGKIDAALTADTGGGRSLVANAELQGVNQAVFAGINVPAGANGTVELRVTNLRADASQSGISFQNVNALLAFNPPSLLSVPNNRVVIGVPTRGLLASNQLTAVSAQAGSPLPEEPGFRALILAGTRFSSTRITEGFAGAFEPRIGTSDVGTRVLIRLAGYPSDARVYAPNVIIGSGSQRPTAAGDYGGPVSSGVYEPGSLALVRIVGSDSNGSGGLSAGLVSATDDVGQVNLSRGDGILVYEVVDSNPSAVESAQIPVFVGVPRTVEARTITPGRVVFLAPISTSSQASANLPIPRFAATSPMTDCGSDPRCLEFLPKLEAYPQPTSFVAFSGANFQILYVPFDNVGGGIMAWTARIEYKNGVDWLRIFPTSGLQGGTVRLDVIPMGLAVGKYEATFIIDAGPAGVARYPVTLDVRALPAPAPVISSVGSAATFTGPVARGGLVTIKGSNLAGTNVSVTFDGKPARILYTSSDQINVQAPADLTGAMTRVNVTARGVASAAFNADVAAVAPGIFSGGVLNQDNRPNTPETPALSPSIVQIFATGLLPVEGDARVEVRLQDTYYSGTDLTYAGQAPGLAGVQQVNFLIPAGLSTMTTDLSVCATVGNGARVCSPAFRLNIRGQ
jgi:uncharacterized protein (TIGR03437 family)